MGVAVMFPGQGSQSPGMGRPWRDADAWALVERAEESLGEPVGELLLSSDPGRLRRTREAQLAVFLTSLLRGKRRRAEQAQATNQYVCVILIA